MVKYSGKPSILLEAGGRRPAIRVIGRYNNLAFSKSKPNYD